jgi:hypothetical protein
VPTPGERQRRTRHPASPASWRCSALGSKNAPEKEQELRARIRDLEQQLAVAHGEILTLRRSQTCSSCGEQTSKRARQAANPICHERRGRWLACDIAPITIADLESPPGARGSRSALLSDAPARARGRQLRVRDSQVVRAVQRDMLAGHDNRISAWHQPVTDAEQPSKTT